MADDFSAATSTSGEVAVGGTASGNIETARDRDWFAVKLVAGRTYTIDLRGSPTDDGTLSDPRLYGIHDADGNLIAHTTNDDWGGTYNSQVTFTATYSGTFYIAAGAFGYYNQGTYTVGVTDDSPADTDSQPDTPVPTDADSARAGATDLGNITALQGPRFPLGTVDGDANQVDYYRFTLTEAKQVGLGLRQQDVNADLFLEDADGNVLYRSTNSGTDNEVITETLLAGTYYLRVESQAAGVNAHVVRYGVSAPDPDRVTALQEQSGTAVNEAPTFGQQGYTFALAENADGSTSRVSLGTVAATDPEGATLAYSLVGGNESGSFDIDAESGVLFYTGAGEDFESGTTRFELTVRASDGSETVDTTVTVNVTDVNETPTFAEASYTFDLAENADSSTNRMSLGTVAATDPEGTAPAYSLVGGNESGSFEVDETSGELFYKGSGEDFESGATRFTLTVRASDGSETTDTTVTVNVTDVDEAVEVDPTDADAARAGATNLGNITALQGPRFPLGTVDGDADQVDYYRFTLTEAKQVGLGLRQQDANADLFLEDANGNVLYRSTNSGTDNEVITETLLAGTYYLRVESQAAGENAHVVRYGVSAPDADAVAALQQQSGTAVNEAPTFAEASYAFALAENADGSTNRVSLGTVAGTDPEGETLAYALVGGNESGSFEVDAASGELFYKGSGEDFESATTRFTLTVRASDGSETTDTTVTVDVTDVDEAVDPPVADGDETALQTVSEPNEEDFSADTSTGGRVVVGETATGDIGSDGDHDWFAVDLVAGRSYTIDLRGTATEDGTLRDPYLHGIHDADGNLIAHTKNDDGGHLLNSRMAFTATETGTHYIAAGALGHIRGTYEVEVTDNSPTFAEGSYTFDLAENADGSTNRISLGAVAATDPEGATLAYNLIGGNESGLFEIDAESGELFYKGLGEDFESATTRFALTVRASDGSETADTTVTVNVTDVDDTPAIRVADAEATEGDDTEMVFRVTLDNASTGTVTVTVNYATADRTATAGEDYTATSGTLTFAPGETEKTVSVTIIDDEVEDSGETFTLVLSDPSGGQLRDTEATGTILNTDPPAVQTSVSEPAGADLPADTTTTGVVAVGGSATGDIWSDGDRDWFAVTLEAGKTYRIDLEGSATSGGTLSDPKLGGIYDTNGTLVDGTTNDDGGTGRNSRVTFSPDASGTFYIEADAYRISEGVQTDLSQGTYTVSVTDVTGRASDDYAADTTTTGTVAVGGSATGDIELDGDGDWFEVTLEAGNTYRIDLVGGTLFDPYLGGIYDTNGKLVDGTTNDDGGRDRNSRVTFSPDASGKFYIAAEAYGISEGMRTDPSQGTYTVSVTDVTDRASDDYAADTTTTGTVAVGGSADGDIEVNGDQDWFAVTLEAGTTYRIDLTRGTMHDPALAGIYDTNGTFINGTTNRDGGRGLDSRVYFTPDDSGTFFIAAKAQQPFPGDYTVSVTAVIDDYADDSTTTGTVTVGGTAASGDIEKGGDRDWFKVTLEAEKTYRIDLKGSDGNAGTQPDPFLRGVYDSAGALMYATTNEDRHDFTFDSRVFFTPSADGAYYISAGAFQDNVGTYKVSVREVPARTDDYAHDNTTTGTVAVGGTARGNIQFSNDRDWFAVALEAGKAYQIDLRNIVSRDGYLDVPELHGIHDADGALIDGITNDPYYTWLTNDSRVYFTPSADGTYYIAAGAQIGSGLYEVAVSEMGDDDYTGHSGTGTGTVAVDGSATGEIQFTGDRDWFAVTLKAVEGGYKIDLKGSDSGGGTLQDPYLRGIYDADGTLINGTANNNLPGGRGTRDSQVIFTPSTDGTYYVAAGAVDGNLGTYSVAVTGVDDHAGDTTTTSTIQGGGRDGIGIGDIQFAGDQDWFKVTLEAGKLYRIFQKGGGPNFLEDPYLRGIHDADGTFIDGTANDDSHENDSPLFKRSEVIFTPSTDGTYYVAAGAAGDHLGTYWVKVKEISDDYADDSTTTGAIAVGGSATGGNIQFVSDHDWFAVALEGGKTYQIEQKADSLSDPYLYGIHDSSGTLIDGTANNDRDESSRDSKVTFTPDADGTYYVAAGAYHYGSYDGRFGTYQVSVTEEDGM